MVFWWPIGSVGQLLILGTEGQLGLLPTSEGGPFCWTNYKSLSWSRVQCQKMWIFETGFLAPGRKYIFFPSCKNSSQVAFSLYMQMSLSHWFPLNSQVVFFDILVIAICSISGRLEFCSEWGYKVLQWCCVEENRLLPAPPVNQQGICEKERLCQRQMFPGACTADPQDFQHWVQEASRTSLRHWHGAEQAVCLQGGIGDLWQG